MKKRAFMFMTLLSIFTLSSCTKDVDFKQIKQSEAYRLMQEEDVIIVDVRTQEEFKSGHIEGAINIPNETIGKAIETRLKDKEATILVYCRSGNRSKQAARKLVNLGYSDIREFGGINTWSYGLVK